MSSSELDVGDGDGSSTLNGVADYLENNSVGQLFTASIAGLVISPAIAFIDVISAVTDFFTTPFSSGAEAIGALVSSFFTGPANVVGTGARITENALATFLGESAAGVLALPVSVAVVLLSLLLIIQYLQEPASGDTLPGVPVDLPFVGVEEEDEG